MVFRRELYYSGTAPVTRTRPAYRQGEDFSGQSRIYQREAVTRLHRMRSVSQSAIAGMAAHPALTKVGSGFVPRHRPAGTSAGGEFY